MKITYKGDYALKAVLDLALHYNIDLVTTGEMAKRIDAPIKFLEQVLLELKKGGFVVSRRGKVGGYMLSRAPGKITVAQVAALIEGSLEPIPCIQDGYKNCADSGQCVLRGVWQKVSQAVHAVVDNITFEDLAAQAGVVSEEPAYYI